MHPVFLQRLHNAFPGQFTVEANEAEQYIVFPPKHPDFGSICIYEDSPGNYTVGVGKFTHSHFDSHEGADDATAAEAAGDITVFLEELFADRIICYGSHESSGGWYRKEWDGRIDWTDLYVWSGAYKPD